MITVFGTTTNCKKKINLVIESRMYYKKCITLNLLFNPI